jgi:putative endonuclease
LERHFVYILQSQKDGSYYVGASKNVETRLDQHNRGAGRSTRARRPWRLIYTEEHNTRSEAVRREGEIKKQKSRFYIESIISFHEQQCD